MELSSTNTKKEFREMLSESQADIIQEIKRMEVKRTAAGLGEVPDMNSDEGK